jgi:hypothetical protein
LTFGSTFTNIHEGMGGTKVVEFWAIRSPPRKFAIGAGYGDEALIRSSVATRTKEVGGDAAIQINDNTTFAGLIGFGSNIYAAANARKMSFAEMLAELELKRTENTLGI